MAAPQQVIRLVRYGASALALALLAAYRGLLSATLTSLTGCGCRFEPTCSHYASGAIGRFGLVRGGRLAAARLWRCRPGGGWGFDPVPPLQNPISKTNRNKQD